MHIYWAAGFFDQAQSAFNLNCAHRLRAAGHTVFLPQELDLNDPGAEPDSIRVFQADKAELAAADALVAVIDGEAIDSGVATEIGLAASLNKGVLGLLTDLRANRSGEGRIYRNLFTVGLIRQSGGLFYSVDDLLDGLDRLDQDFGEFPLFSVRDLGAYIRHLERSYVPRWSVFDELTAELEHSAGVVVDFGCGTGTLLEAMRTAGITNSYYGVDTDTNRLSVLRESTYTDSSSECGTDRSGYPDNFGPVTHLVLSFVCHELADPVGGARELLSHYNPKYVIAYDLCPEDLPNLCSVLENLYPPLPSSADRRHAIREVPRELTACGYLISSMDRIELEVTFERPEDIARYAFFFDVLHGQDMPVGPVSDSRRFWCAINRFDYPWSDKRVFEVVKAVRSDHAGT